MRLCGRRYLGLGVLSCFRRCEIDCHESWPFLVVGAIYGHGHRGIMVF
jgi:hypothetical protein